MFALQGYAKLALQEGFHDWALPSFAVRGSASQLLGTDQVDMTVFGFDVLISKAFSIGRHGADRAVRGWNVLFIDARSGVIDATPGVRRVRVQHAAAPAQRQPGVRAGGRRHLERLRRELHLPAPGRHHPPAVVFGGFKLKLAVLFLTAEYDLVPARSSRMTTAGDGAVDGSGRQQTLLALGGVRLLSETWAIQPSEGAQRSLAATGSVPREAGPVPAQPRSGRELGAAPDGVPTASGALRRRGRTGMPPWMIFRRPATDSRESSSPPRR